MQVYLSMLKMPGQTATTYDAFLLVSFGGPEGMNDVLPFLKNVLRGKNVPEERMLAVARHYELFGGISPINEHNRQLISALKPLIESSGPKLPIYWGNRNWYPLLADTVKKMSGDGVKHAIAFVTAAYSSYSSCRQYLEDIEKARAAVGPAAPRIDKIGPFYNHPGFIAANADQLLIALRGLSTRRQQEAKIIFTAHSIPLSMSSGCRYEEQLDTTCRSVMREAQISNGWQLCYQSRSGPLTQPWLEPDLNQYITQLAEQGIKDIVIAPIGFVSDHMEIIYDLDTEARKLCQQLHINYTRAKTAGCHPKFVSMIGELCQSKIDSCSDNCCPYSSNLEPLKQLNKCSR